MSARWPSPRTPGVCCASAADRSAAVEQARERRVFTSALDVGVRLIGPEETFTGGPQPAADVALPVRARVPVTLRADGRSWRILSTRVTGPAPVCAAPCGCSRPTPPPTPRCAWSDGAR
ncbi:hypothetical protein O1M63_52960 [Streptomyces mirabilis]|nr:hypothetical protein [Streptomyces mirabilis]